MVEARATETAIEIETGAHAETASDGMASDAIAPPIERVVRLASELLATVGRVAMPATGVAVRPPAAKDQNAGPARAAREPVPMPDGASVPRRGGRGEGQFASSREPSTATPCSPR